MSTFWVFINFLDDYNRYEVENFSVYLTFNELSKNLSHFVLAQNFIICSCLRYVDIMLIFLRNCVFRFRQKYPLANFRVELFSRLAREHSWWISPSIYSAFSSIKTWTVPPIAFARDVDIDSGTLVSREPQTRRLCKHSLNFSQCNKYH